MTLFTALDPNAHGVSTEKDRLSPDVRTLPELLKQAGYRTVGLFTNEWIDEDFGFGRGFDRYERLRHRLTYSDRIVDEAVQITTAAQEVARPLFLFLHFMDPHSDFSSFRGNKMPYYSPEAARTLGASAAFCSDDDESCATHFLIDSDRSRHPVDASELDLIRQLYLMGLRYVDADLGRFFKALRESGRYDSSVIVVTSDHGEEFREHGRFLHSQVYRESLHVPLLIKWPEQRYAGTRIDRAVRLMDVAPTVLDILGLEPSAEIEGRSLATLASGLETRVADRPVLGQDKLRRSRYSLQIGAQKLIYDFNDETIELYDLVEDPWELAPVTEAPEDAAAMLSELKRHLRELRRFRRGLRKSDESGSALSVDERERLRALGYVD